MARTCFPFGYWPTRYLPGWYWPNISSGHRVYRGAGGLANVDLAVPVGFTQAGATAMTLVGAGHAASARYTYVVRPVAGCGWLETPDLSNACEFETDADGEWLGNRPAAVQWLAAVAEKAGNVRLSWSWRGDDARPLPADFALYSSTSPAIAPGSPQAAEAFGSEGLYSHTFALSGGQSYWFAVTARTAGGVESHLSEIIGPVVADAAIPAPPSVTIATTFQRAAGQPSL